MSMSETQLFPNLLAEYNPLSHVLELFHPAIQSTARHARSSLSATSPLDTNGRIHPNFATMGAELRQ